MSETTKDEQFHFLQREEAETGDEFLKQRLAFIRDEFSYEELSGLSEDELVRQAKFCHRLIQDTVRRFANPDSIWADEVFREVALDEKAHKFYDPLTDEQRLQIKTVDNELTRNFDKAREDARQRKIDRWTSIVGSVPGLRRLRGRG